MVGRYTKLFNGQRLMILLCLSLLVQVATGQTSFSLEEAMQYATGKNPEIQKKQLNISDADARAREVRATGMPKLNGGIDYQHFIDIPVSLVPADAFGLPPDLTNFLTDVGDATSVPYPEAQGGGGLQELQFGLKNSLTATLGASALIFDGSFLVGLKAARVYKDLAIKELDQSVADVKLQVAKAYLAALISQKNKEIIDKNIANILESLTEIRALYANGFAEKLDVDRLELSYRNLQGEAQRIDRLIRVSENLLKFQMGYPLDESIELRDDLEVLVAKNEAVVVDLDAPVEAGKRPEFKVLETAQALNDLNIQQYKAGYLPSLSAFGRYQRVFQANNINEGKWFPTTVVGATLNIPLFDGLDKKSKIQRASIEGDRIKIDRETFRRSVELEVQNARINYKNAIEALDRQRQSEELAQSIYQTTQIKYREGVGSSVEVTQAESALYSAQAAYINALYDVLIAKTDLDKALGDL